MEIATIRLPRSAVVVGFSVVLTATALQLAGDGKAGAARTGDGVLNRQTYGENDGPAGSWGFALSGCTDPANTGVRGKGVLSAGHHQVRLC